MKIKIGGDLGDSCYSLPVIESVPNGPHDIYFADSKWCGSFLARCHLVQPLFEAQPYVKSVTVDSNAKVDLDLTGFRIWHRATTTLTLAQWEEANARIGLEEVADGSKPWLTVPGKRKASGKIVIARSPRYQNRYFPWKTIVDHYDRDRFQFVGLPEEHERFEKEFGEVNYLSVNNFLDLAKHIRNAELFIGNQSSPMAIAMGLGVPIIQEICLEQPDCVFRRDNVQYVSDGNLLLPDLFGSGELPINYTLPIVLDNCSRNCPPGHWQYPSLPAENHFHAMVQMVMKLEMCDYTKAEEKLMLYNVDRLPEYFQGYQSNPKKTVDIAIKNAYNQKPVISE